MAEQIEIQELINKNLKKIKSNYGLYTGLIIAGVVLFILTVIMPYLYVVKVVPDAGTPLSFLLMLTIPASCFFMLIGIFGMLKNKVLSRLDKKLLAAQSEAGKDYDLKHYQKIAYLNKTKASLITVAISLMVMLLAPSFIYFMVAVDMTFFIFFVGVGLVLIIPYQIFSSLRYLAKYKS